MSKELKALDNIIETFIDKDSEDIKTVRTALKDYEKKTKLDSVHKLGQLEDIEEDLGIDLITLFKALTNDVYLYHNKKLTKCEQAPCLLCFDNEYCLEFHFEYDIEQVYLKDYGKTWALTKEELQ